MAESEPTPAFIDFLAIEESRPKRQCEEKEGIDIIGSLPDHLLCHILSFLPTRSAIEASQLSSRWRYLWESVDSFNFDDSLHTDGLSLNKPKSFIKFGDKVFDLSSRRTIRRFQLKCLELNCSAKGLHEWICQAVARSPQELVVFIDFVEAERFVLSESVLTCRTLVVLRLLAFCSINLSSSILFPNLKTLHLHLAKFEVDDPTKTVLAGCPVLEELSLGAITFDNVRTLSFCSETLRRLHVTESISSRNSLYNLIVDAPKLEHLHIEEYFLEGFQVTEMPLLREARISILPNHFPRLEEGDELRGVYEFLRNIPNVEQLWLVCNAHLEPLNVPAMLPVFRNLTSLSIAICGSWQLMFQLLQSSPNLKTITCGKIMRCSVNRQPRRRDNADVCIWNRPDVVPQCMSRITEIDITINGCVKEIELIGYIFKNATSLKKMRIIRSKYFVKRWEKIVLKEIGGFSRGSTACKVEFSFDEES